MNDQPTHIVTRDGLRDGSLLAAARLRAPPGTVFRTDAEIEADLDAALAAQPPGSDVWLFGYGSLMWNPALHFDDRVPASVRGWHRRFCLWLHMGRGSPENPGLMLALERGGACHGVVYRIAAARAREELMLAWKRELFTGAYLSRWVVAQTATGPVRAATFVANRNHPRYAGRLPDHIVADRLANATGTLGTCRTYLEETAQSLRQLGRRDRTVERLQALITAPPTRRTA
jgi:glutathione-specific gamma-glutamylcyclotransferase